MIAFRICTALLLCASAAAVESIPILPKADKDAGPSASVTIDIKDRPLSAVLEYLSSVSGITIRTQDPKLDKLPVTLDNVANLKWQSVVDLICRQHKLRIDDSRLKEKIVTLYRPEFVNLSFNNADVREAIMALATSGNLNVVLDNEVTGTITARLTDITHEEALDILVKTAGYVAVRDKTGTLKIY
jgi:type II secretory pathway component HofQ